MYCNYLNFTHTNLVSLKKYCRYRDSIFATLHQGFPNTIWCYPTNRPATWGKVNKWRPIERSATASKCHLGTEIMLESLMLMFSNKCSWPTDDTISTAYGRSKVWHYHNPLIDMMSLHWCFYWMSVRLLLEADLICGLGVVSYFAASIGCGDGVISWSTALIWKH